MYPGTNIVQKELIPIVDRDGIVKPVLQIIVEEAVDAGIEEVCIVANVSNAESVRRHFQGLTVQQRATAFRGKDWALRQSDRLNDLGGRITFAIQETQEGYGHAVFQARAWVGDEPFLLLLGDHVYLSDRHESCTAQVLQTYGRFGGSLSSATRTPEDQIHRFGTLQVAPLPDRSPGLFTLLDLAEKPSRAYAREHLRVAGLPDDEYLCLFGINVYTPAIFEYIARLIRDDIRDRGEIQLATAQAELARAGGYIACTVDGRRLDMGVPEGLIETQVAFAMRSPYRDLVQSMFSAPVRSSLVPS